MPSSQPDPHQGVGPRPSSRSLPIARACSIEIRVHQAIFLVVVLPVLGLFFPTCFTVLSVYVAGNAIVSFPDLSKPSATSTYSTVLVLLCGSLLVAVAAFMVRRALRREFLADRLPEGRNLPKGPKGDLLIQHLAAIWERLPASRRPLPAVVWYSNFNILAHAYDFAGSQTIEVSSSLWERITRNAPVAEGILAHETAHLVFRDPPVFRAISVATTTFRRLLRLVLWIGIAAATIVALLQVASDIASRSTVGSILEHACAIAAVTALVLVALPLSVVIVRRYSGFIVSLMEIRADVSAALWTSGLTSFAAALASDPTLRKSTVADMYHSLVSLDLVHISETERLDLLKSTDRLITPKTRYFALSLTLPLLIPINAVTYLIEGGVVDHVLVTAIVVAFQFAAIAMVLVGSQTAELSWRRTWFLGGALCLLQALPRIDLGSIGYLFTNYSVAIATPGGFGSNPMTLAQIFSDFSMTMKDVASKVTDATDGAWFALAVIVVGGSLQAISTLARRPFGSWLAPTIVATTVSFLSSFDRWRDTSISIWSAPVVEAWFSWTKDATWVRLCSPSVAALAVLLLQRTIKRSGRKRVGLADLTNGRRQTPWGRARR